MAHEIYISYSPQDRKMAEAVCEALESKEYGCWFAARDIIPGLDRGEALIEAMDSSRLMILQNELQNQSQNVLKKFTNKFKKIF